MSRQFSSDFLIEVQKGLIAGHSMVHKFGRNDALVNGAWEFIGQLSVTGSFRSSAAVMRVKAGGTGADTESGSGAQTLTIQGIDSNLAETSEVLTLAGASASSVSTTSFWRIHRAWVSAVGTYGAANSGIITVEDESGSGDMILIASDEGQTQHACWTVPTGKTAYLLSVHASTDSAKSVNLRCFTRSGITDVTAPMAAKRLKLYWDGVQGTFNYRPEGPELSIEGASDFWFEGWGDGAAAECTVDFELLVVDD